LADEITRFDRLEITRLGCGYAIASGLYSVVVLDELNPVLNLGLLPVDEVVQVLKSKPEELEMLLVGCPQHLLNCRLAFGNETRHPIAAEQGISGIEVYTGAGKESLPVLGKALQAIGRGVVRISLTAS